MTQPTKIFSLAEVQLAIGVTKAFLGNKMIDFPEFISMWKNETNLREEMGKTLNLLLNLESALKPIPMVLYCPYCLVQHIDDGEWATKPHRRHLCQNPECGLRFIPAKVNTFGVRELTYGT